MALSLITHVLRVKSQIKTSFISVLCLGYCWLYTKLHKMATEDHILEYFCRICGEIAKSAALTNNERFERLGWKSKKSEDVSYVLQKQYGEILENDKEDVHPSKICSKCKERISSVYKMNL